MTESVIISVDSTQKFIGEEKQSIRIVTDGTMKMDGDTTYISYEESEISGMEGTTTTFEVKDNHVVLRRSGAVESEMVFEKGKKDISLYNVGFGAMTIGVQARRLKNELGPQGGRLEISYGIEIGEQVKGLNSFIVNVRPAESRELPQ